MPVFEDLHTHFLPGYIWTGFPLADHVRMSPALKFKELGPGPKMPGLQIRTKLISFDVR